MKSLRNVNIDFTWFFSFFLAAILVLFFQGCGGGSDGAAEEEPVTKPAPAISSTEPTTIYQGTMTSVDVTVNGSNFDDKPSVQLIAEDSTTTAIASANITFNSSTRITFSIIPSDFEVGLYDVKLINPDGKSTTLADGLEITGSPPPTVTSVTPTSGWDQEDTRITITGEDFISTPQVIIGTTSAKNVAFVDGTSITATVPAGMAAGTYDITVTNPNGLSGPLASAFMVSYNPPPSITEISPTIMVAADGGTLTISGKNFVIGCEVYISDDPNDNQKINITTTFISSTELQCDVPGDSDISIYIVYVFNPDGQFASYNSLKLASSAQGKLGDTGPFVDSGKNLLFGRRGHAATVGKDDIGNSFIYVAGGNDERNTFSSVEFSISDIFGNLSKWKLTKPLNSARTEFGLITGEDSSGTNYLYAIGGRDSSGAPLASIERARVLTTATQPQNFTAQYVSGGSLPAGNWIYRVSAVLTDGEGLPSDIASINITSSGSIRLDWDAVSGASSYKIYRVDEVEGRIGREHLLAENILTNTFTDDGTYSIIQKSVSDTPSAELSASLGTMADGTWYYKITAVTVNGEKGPSPAAGVDLSTGGNGAVDLTCQAQSDAIYYNIYRTESPDSTSNDVYLIAERVLGTTFTDTGLPLILAQCPSNLSGSPTSVTGGALTTGTYYYQVSGITERGETLPSIEISVYVDESLGENAAFLSWDVLPDVISYNLYRSTTSGAEVLIKSDILTTKFSDSGLPADNVTPADGKIYPPSGKMSPVPFGTIGDWSTLHVSLHLNQARYGFGVVKTPMGGTMYVYVVCGHDGAFDLDTVERTYILSDGGFTAWTIELNTVPTPRRYLAASKANTQNHPDITGDTAYVYAMEGISGASGLSSVEGAEVQTDGSLGVWGTMGSDPSTTHYGLSGIVGNGYMYPICGIKGNSPSTDVDRGTIDGSSGALIHWASASAKPNISRAFQAITTVNSYIYIIGGQTSSPGASITTTHTVEQIPF